MVDYPTARHISGHWAMLAIASLKKDCRLNAELYFLKKMHACVNRTLSNWTFKDTPDQMFHVYTTADN